MRGGLSVGARWRLLVHPGSSFSWSPCRRSFLPENLTRTDGHELRLPSLWAIDSGDQAAPTPTPARTATPNPEFDPRTQVGFSVQPSSSHQYHVSPLPRPSNIHSESLQEPSQDRSQNSSVRYSSFSALSHDRRKHSSWLAHFPQTGEENEPIQYDLDGVQWCTSDGAPLGVHHWGYNDVLPMVHHCTPFRTHHCTHEVKASQAQTGSRSGLPSNPPEISNPLEATISSRLEISRSISRSISSSISNSLLGSAASSALLEFRQMPSPPSSPRITPLSSCIPFQGLRTKTTAHPLPINPRAQGMSTDTSGRPLPANPRAQGQQRQRPEGVKHIVAVASGKGGVGKSTTAVNLAAALAHSAGLRVGLLDADVYGPSIPRLLNLHGRPQIIPGGGDGGRSRMRGMQAYGITCMSMGFLMDEDSAAVWRGPMVMSALEQMMWATDWGHLDVLLVDMPPGTGDAQLTIAQRTALSGVVIVSTPQDLALLDAKRGAIMFRKVNVPILGLIENMSYFVCPSCGERSDIFSHGGAKATALAMDMDFLGEIPLQTRIRQLSDMGKPVVVADPTSDVALAYGRIAEELKTKLFGQNLEAFEAGPKIVFE